MRRCAPAIVLGLVLVWTLPAVHAQPDPTAPAASASFPETPDRLAPLGDPETLPIAVAYDCTRQDPAEETTIVLDVVESPDWLTVALDPARLHDTVDPTTCAADDGRRTVEADTHLTADGGAPARVPANLTVQATVALADGNHTAEATVPVQAAFYSVVRLDGPTHLRTPADQAAGIPVHVRNDGNGPIQVTLQVAEADDGLDLQMPDPGVAPAPWQDGEPTWNGTIVADGQDPATLYEATIEVHPRYAEDPTVAGRILPHRIVLQTDGLTPASRPDETPRGVVAVPAFAAGLVATVGLGAALLRRSA